MLENQDGIKKMGGNVTWLGILIWRQFPLSGAWALGLTLGFKMVLVGLTMAGVGRQVQREGA
jgi:uncharacterized membrane protein HdeD (DUF308 family)